MPTVHSNKDWVVRNTLNKQTKNNIDTQKNLLSNSSSKNDFEDMTV